MPCQEDDVLRMTCKMLLHGKVQQNVYHFQLQGTDQQLDDTVLTDMIQKISNAHEELIGEQQDALTYETVEVWNVTQDRSIGEEAWDVITAGTNVSGLLPTQTAALVLYPTLVARSQGRKFLGGLTENANNVNGDPDEALIAALVAYALHILTPRIFGEGTAPFGNYNYLFERFATWFSARVVAEWKTQRRRYRTAGV